MIAEYPSMNIKTEVAMEFVGGFECKTQSTEATSSEDNCLHVIRKNKRSNFYEQI